MWVEKKRSWIETVLFGGFALPHIWRKTLLVTGLSIGVTILYEEVESLHYSITATPFTLIGLPLGIFLGFRNNTAYDRFWEGRKLWGSLVNTSRSVTRQVLTLVDAQDEAARTPETRKELEHFRRRFVYLVIGFVHALRHHLRDTDPFEPLGHIIGEEETDFLTGQENVPYAILQRMGELLVEARRKGWIHPMHVPVLEGSLTELTDVQGACERIKSTPIPYSYTVLMHRIVATYCTLLPFGMMDAVGWTTPFIVLAISYCFFGLSAIGDELEQPFGMDINDLPLKAISRTIERNLRERLGEKVPPPVEAKGYILT
ncbi:MAG: bestrophin family protein [Labilithrix sp.]|nr:bestrophin family protein [Labilithrix sp.]MCW5831368.1 bestrophin family protein [Labilithrix sp.]